MKTLEYLLIILCAAASAVLLYKLIRIIAGRAGFYGALKKYCEQNGGMVKKNSLFRSFFKAYPGYDIEMSVSDKIYGIKFFPGYLKNKNLLIENEKKACLLKNTGVMGVSWRGSLPGVRTLTPDVIYEVTGRRIKIDLSADPEYKNILIFSPKCRRIYYVKKSERAEAYNGDNVCGYTVFYDKKHLIESLTENEK